MNKLMAIMLTVVLAGFLSAATIADEGDAPDAGAQSQPADNEQAKEGDAEKAAEPEEPTEEEVALSFKDVPLEKISSFISEKLNKPVIPHETLKDKKITIITAEKRPLSQALMIISEALRQRGIIIQEYPLFIEMLPIAEAHRTKRLVVPADESLEALVNKSQIVDKVFAVEHYDVAKLQEVVVKMLPEHGFVVADPNGRQLIVTDSVANLMRVAEIIKHLDVPMADQRVSKIFKLEHRDAAEIISIVRMLIAGELGAEAKDIITAPGGGKEAAAAAKAVLIKAGDVPVLLVPEVSRNWIIAVAPAHVMKIIAQRIDELDVPKEIEEPYELIPVKHVDVGKVAAQIQNAIKLMPQTDMTQSIGIAPFPEARQLVVFGSKRGLKLVKSLLKQLDIEDSEHRQIREFALQYADAETVAEKIEALFSRQRLRYQSYYSRSYDTSGEDPVKVTPDTRRNTVTVVTDPKRMEEIERLIKEEWDTELTIDDVVPKVYELKYADPVKIKELLEDLFTRQRTTTGYFWNQRTEDSIPIGRLAGQFTFEAMADSNKLIVSTRQQSNYRAIDDLIKELDQPPTAGLPVIVDLKHANAEDLAEQINALLNEPGTPASIRRSPRGLTAADREAGVSTGQAGGSRPNNQQQPEQQRPDEMAFWWTRATRRIDERPTSNLIGRPRIVPVYRQNAVMVLAPPAYVQPMIDLIHQLDRAGMQVVIDAIIAEVEHEDASTLGLRIASDPSLLAGLGDQSIGIGANVDLNRLFGDTFTLGADTFARGLLDADIRLSALLQLLIKKLNMRVLSQPKIYTGDNQQAEFFDGQDVPFQVSSAITDQGGVTRSFDYEAVGTRLLVRPHITRDEETGVALVTLTINLEISRVVPGQTLEGNFFFDRRETTTHVIVENGQTVLLSGIIRQQDFKEVRKLPLLGDLPLIGGAFRSTDQAWRNREMLVFITPRVISTGTKETDKTMEQYREELKRLRSQMGQPFGENGVDEAPDEPDNDEPDGDDADEDASPTPPEDTED